MATGERYRDDQGDVWEETAPDLMLWVVYSNGERRDPGFDGPAPREWVERQFGPLTPVLRDPEPTAAQPLAEVLASLREEMRDAWTDTREDTTEEFVFAKLEAIFDRAAKQAAKQAEGEARP